MLCEQSDVEAIIQVTFGDPADSIVAFLIGIATARIETLVDRTFADEAGIIETLDGGGRSTLYLSKWPVSTITSVVEDGVTLTANEHYLAYMDRGKLVRGTSSSRWRWTYNRQGVVVTYDGGYATIPADIVGVCAGLVGRMFLAAAALANTSVDALALESVSLEGSDEVKYRDIHEQAAEATLLTPTDISILAKYQRVGFG